LVVIGLARAIITKLRAKNFRLLRNNCLDFTRVFKFSLKEIILDNSKGYEISLILDASGSMQESNKFGVVKKILVDFIKQRKTDKLALSIFADFAYTAVPLTYDKKSIIEILSHIDVGIAGQQRTALYEALFLSSKLFD
jgi:Ca-activated chloride channel family protein